ncbi:MAG TPA: OmpA family protein, partial [Bacteroidota bacterium]|nr:OmpA family protein [Bacteroidota bacterium]
LQRDFSEHTGVRLRGRFLSVTADNPAYSYLSQRIRTNMGAVDADLMYLITPCEPVIPYLSLGVGGVFYMIDTKIPIAKKFKDGDAVYQFNLGVGAEWKLGNTVSLITDLGYHTANTSSLDGFKGTSGGFFGARNDAYMAFSVGLSIALWREEPSHLNDAYAGITFPPHPPMPEPVDYQRVDELIKSRIAAIEPVDYAKILSMISANKPVIKQQPERIIIEKKAPVAFEMINFAVGSTKLDKEAINSLNRAVAILNDNTELTVELQGHTDAAGSREINKKLSEERALSVKRYLINKGIASSRLSVMGMVMADPLGDNATTEGRALNRRVELKIVKK